VSLQLNTGSRTTTEAKTALSGTVTEGASVLLTVTYPSELAEGPAAAKPSATCGQGVKLCVITTPVPAHVHGSEWTATVPVSLGDKSWQSGEVARGEKKAVEAENVIEVSATKVGYVPAKETVTITREQTSGQGETEEKAKEKHLKEEEANPNSEFNKNEREVEAEVKKKEEG
jgi:hypothetical protein